MRRILVFFLICLLPLQLLDQSYFDSASQPTTYVPYVAEAARSWPIQSAEAAVADVETPFNSSVHLEPDLSDSVDSQLTPRRGSFANMTLHETVMAELSHVVYLVVEPPRG